MDSPSQLDNSLLPQLVGEGVTRVQDELTHLAPYLAEQVRGWMEALSPTGRAPDYFLQPRMFPVLRLPLWAAKMFAGEFDHGFLADITYSTINGYYYIRLLDNLMDGHGTVELNILAATAFFHTEFQSIYQRYFPAAHPFWAVFRSAWLSGSEAVTQELSLNHIDEREFERVCVAKLAPARIPVSAVGYHYGAGERIRVWEEFTLALARFSQMEDDLFDWHHDLCHRKSSHFLFQARGRRGEEPLSEWVIREGLPRGLRTLRQELFALRRLIPAVASREAEAYLDGREEILAQQEKKIAEALKILQDIADIAQGSTAETCI